MVADVHHTLLYGGIFLYPGDRKSPNGKLRPNWQHQLCKNPHSNLVIKTLFTDHTCAPNNRAHPPLIGVHSPLQPVVPPASAIARWISNNNPSLYHATVAAWPPGLV